MLACVLWFVTPIAMGCSTTGDPSRGVTPATQHVPTPTANVPPASAGHSLVYADDLEMVLLVNAGLGGMNPPPSSSRTRIWGWTGTQWTVLDSLGPPIRNLGGVAYDTRRHVLVMHGGSYDLGRSYGETWEWSRQSGWRQFTSGGPGVRDHTQMAFDSQRGRVVLFGGSGTDPNLAFADVWEFDGTRWERLTATGPAPRVHHAMQYDPVSRRVVVFGGFTPGGSELGDTWAWDGTRWTNLGTSTARTHARMAFHGRLNALVLLGGSGSSFAATIRSDTGWTLMPTAGQPSARYLADAAFDTKRGVLVLFGGGDPAGMSLFADTWEHDGTSWRRIP